MGIGRRIRRGLHRVLSSLEKPFYQSGIVSADKMPLPDFLGIGAMKAGTTWMYENLRHHPEIYLADKKETYFFSYQFNQRRISEYSQRFVNGVDLVKGEITPGYSILPPKRIRFIRAVVPKIKLILLLRDPVERSWSEAYMNLVVKAGRNLHDVGDNEFYSYFRSQNCIKRSSYVSMLDNWLRVFPSSQLYIGLYDDIQQAPQLLLSEIFTFLGVSCEVDWERFPCDKMIVPRYEKYGGVHQGEMLDAHRTTTSFLPARYRDFLTNMYAPGVGELRKRYGIQTGGWRSSPMGNNQGIR